jgi:putative addiction module component (TIGR02574 family)
MGAAPYGLRPAWEVFWHFPWSAAAERGADAALDSSAAALNQRRRNRESDESSESFGEAYPGGKRGFRNRIASPNRPSTSPVDLHPSKRYQLPMSTQQLTSAAMSLPLSERVSLAQALWQSIDMDVANTDEDQAVAEAIRRDQELTSGAVVGRTHDDVMQAARQAIGCA